MSNVDVFLAQHGVSLCDPKTDAFLAHHGVLGMKWHHHKTQDEGSGKSAYVAAIPTANRSVKHAAKALKENSEKAAAKMAPAGVKNLTPQQKKALKIAAATVVVAGTAALIAYQIHNKQAPSLPIRPGEKIAVSDWIKQSGKSEASAWGVKETFIQPSSFDHEEMTFPAGHVFHRVSISDEKEYNPWTYAAPSMDDFHRYVVSGTGLNAEEGVHQRALARELGTSPGLYHVTFKAEKPLRIPSLDTAIETLRESMSQGRPEKASRAEALNLYDSFQGSPWTGFQEGRFITALKAKGFDGVVDEMDQGVRADSPLILFSHDKLSSKVATLLSEQDIKGAEANLKELLNRKQTLQAAA